MKPNVLIFTVLCCFVYAQAQLTNLLNTPTHNCIICLCHARTGCYSRQTCARYSINFDYWRRAGSPTLSSNDDKQSQASYRKCIANENCILHAIKNYTDSFGRMDCNCDGVYDCRDMLALHLDGEECGPSISAVYLTRYNNCARTQDVPPFVQQNLDVCIPEAV